MKKYLFLAVAVLAAMGARAQDTIIFRNGDELKVKVTEVSDTQIKYRLFSNQNGPVYTKNTADIFMVKYQGGHREVYQQQTQQTQQKAVAPQQQYGGYNPANGIGYRSGHMEASRGDLVLNGHKLSDGEIKQLIGEDGYMTYASAAAQRRSGKWFVALGWIETVTGVAMLALSDGDEDLVTYGAVLLAFGQIELPLGYVLRGVGNGRLDWIADNYNQSQLVSHNLSLSMGPSLMTVPNGVGGSSVAMGAGLRLHF